MPGGSACTIAISVSGSSGAPYGMPMHSWISTGSSSSPSRSISFTITRWPVSNTSSSGFTPSACTCFAIARSVSGVLTIT